MKKNILLSFCLLCFSGVSACSVFSDDESKQISYDVADEDMQIINTTTNPQSRCGVDGIGCNDSALVNYTKTEADYRAYGERTPKDQLYTQAGIGNNLTATIRPDVEDDVVTEYEPGYNPGYEPEYGNSEDFTNVGTLNINPRDRAVGGVFAGTESPSTPEKDRYSNGAFAGTSSLDADPKDRSADGIFANTSTIDIDPTDRSSIASSKVGRVDTIYGPGYEIVCTEECEDFADLGEDFTKITSDSLDIDVDNLEFEEIGNNDNKESIEVKVEEKITDDTILAWDAQEGDTLRELLTKWSAQSGWKLLWNTNRNYTLSAGVMFKGKFTDVSSALIRAFARARPAPIATFYKGNRVIVVETMENENAY